MGIIKLSPRRPERGLRHIIAHEPTAERDASAATGQTGTNAERPSVGRLLCVNPTTDAWTHHSPVLDINAASAVGCDLESRLNSNIALDSDFGPPLDINILRQINLDRLTNLTDFVTNLVYNFVLDKPNWTNVFAKRIRRSIILSDAATRTVYILPEPSIVYCRSIVFRRIGFVLTDSRLTDVDHRFNNGAQRWNWVPLVTNPPSLDSVRWSR
ncbi:hypothetical protein EVAR_61370_1 [Eumeta japonica]|uniref:Uncharacterized protein n=1 Tax=Eumeta variegata TaxID=151549 RepID=A0A4C1Z4L0_EUMVA|nr:hypothetical protein EVAR_61370_1 [Eumeta japonica]